MTATGTKWLRATVGRDDVWSVPEKRSLLRCRLPDFNGTDFESFKAPLESFQTRFQLTRFVDDRGILNRSACISVAVTMASL
jgi:hypothetical protein